MNITVTGRHMEMTDALKTYVQNGLTKVTTHFDKVTNADVVLAVEKNRHIAEVNLHANGVRINSKESSSDMYASVDAAIEKLDKQVRKYRDRIIRHKPRRVERELSYSHAVISFEPTNGDQEAVEEAVEHKVVKRDKVPMQPLSVDEAVMQLELLGEQRFLVFSNAETSQVNVLYALEDGTFGLIEPEF